MLSAMSAVWRLTFRAGYRLLALLDPLIRRAWRRLGIGNVVELRVALRDGAGTRSRLVGILRAGGGEYIGHPNGHVGWTHDLLAAGTATIVGPPHAEPRPVAAELLPDGPERSAAILATSQHPFPGNVVYRLARRHVLAVGVYFRLEPAANSATAGRPSAEREC